MAEYKGITFAKGYNRSFAEFKEEFEMTYVFKVLQPKKRESELKKAYKIATDGNIPTTPKKGAKDNAKQGK